MADDSIPGFDRLLDPDDVAHRLGNVAQERFYLSEMKGELLRDLTKIQKDISTMQTDVTKMLELQRDLSGKVAVVGATMVGFGSLEVSTLFVVHASPGRTLLNFPSPV